MAVHPDDIAVAFRKAMRRLTSSVSIIATREEGRNVGMVATAVSSLCASPAAILVCIGHAASIHQPLMRTRRFSVNMLRASQDGLIPIFSGKLKGPERFEHGTWDLRDDLPILLGSQATLLCEIGGAMTYSDHEIVVGRIVGVDVAEHISPLLWQDGRLAHSRPAEQRPATM